MGTIFVCNDRILERKVAIKFIQAHEENRRILDELNALMKVRSKHVVQVYDVIEDNERGLGIVQEYIYGNDLSNYSPPLNTLDFYLKIWQIASGISDIHAVNIIHRDIKPNNMMLDHESIIKIFDFGLARHTQENASTIGFVGTHGFSAPELYTDAPHFTTAIDVYAFGVTALFLANGTLPSEVLYAYGKPVPNNLFTSLPIANEIASLLQSSLVALPEDRPPIWSIKETLEKHILENRHQALITHKGNPTYLNKDRKKITLSVDRVGVVDVQYNGLDFIITRAEGEVFINNAPILVNSKIPTSCVLAIGNSQRSNQERSFITFDLSHPEINL